MWTWHVLVYLYALLIWGGRSDRPSLVDLPVSVLGSGLFFGLFPGLILRAVVQFYPSGHPRREELFGELYHSGMGRLERYEWVFQQFETALREGPSLRKRARQERRIDEQQADTSNNYAAARELSEMISRF